jgi:hypothetical protein
LNRKVKIDLVWFLISLNRWDFSFLKALI